MKNFLFPLPPASKAYSLFLLALRIIFGLLLIRHGIDKLYNYTSLCFTFPDPIGYGKDLALIAVIFTELCCALGFIFGALFRLCLIPMIVVMATAFFYVHGGSLAYGESAVSYLLIFVLMYVSGPGKFSVDAVISYHLHKDEDEDEC
ncbi:MAG: DoxX family protein [Bacteroides sp.]|nr:DoxX family protein [Bacteroides sp.]